MGNGGAGFGVEEVQRVRRQPDMDDIAPVEARAVMLDSGLSKNRVSTWRQVFAPNRCSIR